MTLTPAYPMPLIPIPLPATAAMMPAIHVPWPLGSDVSSVPVRMLVPGTRLADRSGCPESTPVSSRATIAWPVMLAVPKTRSQPMTGSDSRQSAAARRMTALVP